jgi:transposase
MAYDNKILGIDVSKDTLDIYWKGKSFKINNDQLSISDFIKSEIQSREMPLCIMESTGGYEQNAMDSFSAAGKPIHVAHPSRVHAFAKASGHFAKTDKLDAILLHKYGHFIAHKEKGDTLLEPHYREIIALRRLSQSIEKDLHAAQCRLKNSHASCHNRLAHMIAYFEKQIAEVGKEIAQKIRLDTLLKAKQDIMMTLPGVAIVSSSKLLAELPELGTLSSKQAAALVGVAPKTYQSGKKSMGGHISGGRFWARRTLYMVALVASRRNPKMKEKYDRLVAKGKAKKAALVALMNDIIVILNAMIKRMKPYDIRS